MKKMFIFLLAAALLLCAAALLAGCSEKENGSGAETADPAEFSFVPLDEVPDSYGADEACADGCAVVGGGNFDVSAVKTFADSAAQDTPAMLRLVRYEDGGQSVTDVVFDGSFYTCAVRSAQGTEKRVYPFLIARDDGIFLCESVSPSNLENFTKSALYPLVTAEDGDIAEAADAVRELTRHRLSVDSTVYTSFSPDGKRCVAVKLENSVIGKVGDKLEFSVVTPDGIETRGSDDAEEIAQRIIGVEWLDNERYIMSFKTFFDVNYFELYNTQSRKVERHSYCDRYVIENGEVSYID